MNFSSKWLRKERRARFKEWLRSILTRPPVVWRFGSGFLVFLTSFAWGVTQAGENEKRNVDSIYVLDVSQSMVDGVQRVLASKGLARIAPGRVELTSPNKIEKFLVSSTNDAFVKDNILYRNVRLLEQLIDEYQQGNIYIIIFDHGPQDKGPIKAVTGPFHVRSLHDPVKAELKSLLDPHRNGPYAKARDWRGIFVETVFRGSGPTLINTTCEAAMRIFEAAVRQPGYANETYSQQLLLFTDGEELERGKTFPAVLERFNLQRKNIWFEYREIYFGPKPSVETASIHQQLSDACFPPVYSALWRCIRVSGSDKSLTGQATIPRENGGVFNVRAHLQPPVRLKIQADDQKPVEGKVTFRLGECSPLSLVLSSVSDLRACRLTTCRMNWSLSCWRRETALLWTRMRRLPPSLMSGGIWNFPPRRSRTIRAPAPSRTLESRTLITAGDTTYLSR